MSRRTVARRSAETEVRSSTARTHASGQDRGRGRDAAPEPPGVAASRSRVLIAGDSVCVEDRRRRAARRRLRARVHGRCGRTRGLLLLVRRSPFGSCRRLRFLLYRRGGPFWLPPRGRGRRGRRRGRRAPGELCVVGPPLPNALVGLHVEVGALAPWT